VSTGNQEDLPFSLQAQTELAFSFRNIVSGDDHATSIPHEVLRSSDDLLIVVHCLKV
jgi:hypothetical protein